MADARGRQSLRVTAADLGELVGSGTVYAGRGSPSWVDDDDRTHCEGCEAKFNLTRRRHHCRKCGEIFCSVCSSSRIRPGPLGASKQP